MDKIDDCKLDLLIQRLLFSEKSVEIKVTMVIQQRQRNFYQWGRCFLVGKDYQC